jgi:hypothetical protein
VESASHKESWGNSSALQDILALQKEFNQAKKELPETRKVLRIKQVQSMVSEGFRASGRDEAKLEVRDGNMMRPKPVKRSSPFADDENGHILKRFKRNEVSRDEFAVDNSIWYSAVAVARSNRVGEPSRITSWEWLQV